MESKTLSNKALEIIDQYLHFKIAGTSTNIPYFNNKTTGRIGGLRVNIGKGSIEEIKDEINTILVKNRLSDTDLNDELLKKFLIENNIGIDCSGFAYYVLNKENEDRGQGSLDKKISFANKGFFGKIKSSLRPIENCGVSTLADVKNSKVINLKDLQPGDMITMLKNDEQKERDHILVIHKVDYENSEPKKIYYSHSISYPEDGLYGHGVRQGVIEIVNSNEIITKQKWIENGHEGENNQIYKKAKGAKTELRRLNWF